MKTPSEIHSRAALIIAGHGSTVNPDSSAPTHLHADNIRARGLFREVACCFWKEEPSMTEVFESVESEVIYVVPNFISEGYFCQQVLPRELRLNGPVTRRDGRVIFYCDPVGVHPNMTRLLLQRADEVAAGVPRSETSLVIVGHGTNLNENSTKAIQDQVKLIREGNHGFAEVIDAYMEEAPLVAEWDRLTTAANVVVVPFFIADGLHSFQDIPVLLGIEQEPGRAMSELDVFRHNPIPLRGRQLYYSQAIGTEALMAEVILDQVADFDAQHDTAGLLTDSTEKPASSRKQALLKWLDEGRDVIGQILIRRQGESFSLCHLEDEASTGLQLHATVEAARELARHNEAGAFRPIKTAPDLRRGWQLNLTGVESLLLALEFFYPAALGLAQAEEAGTLRPVPLRNLLGRQTGMYRFANNITDDQACEIIGSKCRTSTHCLRRIVFSLNEGQAFHGAAMEKLSSAAGGVPKGLNERRAVPLLCMEACNHIVSAARSVARKSYEEKAH